MLANSRAISTAASAASRPLFDGPGAARSSASSAELVVSTPNDIGTPVLPAAAVMPCAHAEAMYSKCGVSPLIRQPRQTTASTPSGLGDALRRHRNLERARHAQHLDIALGDAGIAQRRLRADQQAVGDEIVEARDDNGYPHYFPCQTALRFSRNALVPSFMSADEAIAPNNAVSRNWPRVERAVESMMHGFEDVANRDRRLRRQRVRDLLRFAHQLRRRHDAIDEADLIRALRADHVAGQQDLERHAAADEARQPLAAAHNRE